MGSVEEDTIALEIRVNNEKTFFYIPGCASVPNWLKEKLEGSDVLMFDGTLWTDDEMIKENVGIKTGKRMGHVSMDGSEGSLEKLSKANIGRKIFIHINTTNPVLLENSEERKIVNNCGWEVAYDNMEVEL